jgi:hypothetical protein
MEEKDKCSDGEFWKQKIKKHWKIFAASIIGGAVAIVVALLVLFWFIDTSPIGAMGTATIGEWTLAWIWEFFIFLMLWELLIVGIPVAIVFGVGWYLWWKRLPAEEKAEFKGRWRGKGTAEGGNFAYSYWVYAWFHTLAWLLVIFGIPAAIILTIVYFAVWRKKETEEQIV